MVIFVDLSMERFELTFPNQKLMDDDEFFAFCVANSDLRIEREPNGQIIIMAPTGGNAGNKNSEILFWLAHWNRLKQLGFLFDSSTGFRLKSGAIRSPDASWIKKDRWEALSQEAQDQFIPIAPDFIMELVSPSDHINPPKNKMEEWMQEGCLLGWLIDPKNEHVHIYRADGSIQIIKSFEETLSGEDVLEGFELELKEIR